MDSFDLVAVVFSRLTQSRRLITQIVTSTVLLLDFCVLRWSTLKTVFHYTPHCERLGTCCVRMKLLNRIRLETDANGPTPSKPLSDAPLIVSCRFVLLKFVRFSKKKTIKEVKKSEASFCADTKRFTDFSLRTSGACRTTQQHTERHGAGGAQSARVILQKYTKTLLN